MSKGRQIPEEQREFVSAALRRRLIWPGHRRMDEVTDELMKKGCVEIELHGNDGVSAAVVPFYLNLLARVRSEVTEESLKAIFRASVKFGSHRDYGKTSVLVFDANQDPHWHIHPFDSQEGLQVPHSSNHVYRFTGLRLETIGDAVKFVALTICAGGWSDEQESGFTSLSAIPASRGDLSLVV